MNAKNDTDKCVACSTCVVQCPVAGVTSKFLGPRMLGPASERFRLLNAGEDPSLTYCSNCKNCDISCPQNVEVSRMNMMARALYARSHKPSFRDWILAHGGLEAKIASYFPAGIVNACMDNVLGRSVLDRIGVSRQMDLPHFAGRQFPAAVKRYAQPSGLSKKVVFFPGCSVNAYQPQTGLDLVWLLNRAGYYVEIPGNFCCCGTPLYTNGFEDEAKRHALTNLREMHAWERRGIPVLTLCPSCALMFKSEIPSVFPDLYSEYPVNVGDAAEFLLRIMEKGELPGAPRSERKACRVLYHAPCHLRAQGTGLPGYSILSSLEGIHADNANAGCCGISGTYGFKKEKYDIAMAVGSRLFDRVREASPDIVATECGTCQIQITHGTGKACMHPVSILRHMLDGSGIGRGG